MKKQLYPLIGILLFLNVNLSFAQGVANVNPLTGAANVVIPIYTVNRGQVSFPISLAYYTSGVRPTDVEGTAGMGWNLQAGGQISRQVRGLPDDVQPVPYLISNMYGWMSKLDTAANMIAPFTISNNGSTCSNETADISYINTNFPYRDDTEPDVFNVNAPGLSCQLVYNRADSSFHPVSYQDLKISYVINSSTKLITSFTITNDRGITYVFGRAEYLNELTYNYRSTPTFFTTQYNQYKNHVNYAVNWDLTNMTDASGNGVQLTYTVAPARASTDSVSLYIGGASSPTLQYYIQQSLTPYTLTTVQSTDGDIFGTLLTLNWGTSPVAYGATGQTIINTITGIGLNLVFQYNQESYIRSDGTTYNRQFLGSYTDASSTNSPINYTFNYYGETLNSGGSYTTSLPDSTSKQVDYWGYYAANGNTSLLPKVWAAPGNSTYHPYMIYQQSSEGSYAYALPGNTMTVDTVHIMTGSLKKITYANGGNTNIVYESNAYYDPITSTSVKGGGIRVKQLIDSIGKGSTNNIIRNYTYLNPTTHASSGKPISLPSFAFTLPYSGGGSGLTLWENSTVLSKADMSNDDHTIMYEYAKESQTGAGSTQYQYYIPASNWDASAHPACNGCTTSDWNPALNYAARNNCTLTYGQVKNSIYSYPFIPNKNYDFERGLPLHIISYNDAGSIVSQADYTYQRVFAPDSLVAFKSDENVSGSLDIKGYNKYSVYYATGELSASVAKTVYDSNGTNTSRTSTVYYAYTSPYHKLLTKQSTINSDGDSLITKMSYAKDFPIGAADTNAYRNGLYYLQQNNMNAPVETYNERVHAGTTSVTGASLTFYKTVPGTLYVNTPLPAQQQQLVQPDGIPATGTGAFVPFSAGVHVPVYDSRYFPTANYTQYDGSGYLLTADDANHHLATSLIDHITYHPTASMSNASAIEFAFNDFDSSFEGGAHLFAITGSGGFASNGSHTGKAYGFATTQTATTNSAITKSALTQNYIFSIWINAPSGSNTLHISLNGGTSVAYTYTANGTWQYHQWPISVSSMPSTFTVSFTSSQNISIDDILFYPDAAQATTYAYNDTTFYKTAQTNTNGVSAYFVNDNWGRNLYTYDQDRNILQKSTYVTGTQLGIFNSLNGYAIYSNVSGTMQVTKPVTFSLPSIGISSGATAAWNFGDGSTHVTVPVTATVTHTYATAANYTVTAKITSPYLGTKSVDTVITIIPVVPSPIQLSYTNNTTGYAGIAQVVFTPTAGGTPITVDGAHLYTAQIPKAVYNISVSLAGSYQYPYPLSGSGGYTCLYINGDCWTICSAYQVHNLFSYTNVDLTGCSTLNFTVSTFDCSHFPH